MTCETVTLPTGGVAIVCGTGSRKKCECGAKATLECDWKVPTRRSGTCDKGICRNCATSPAPGKDLCKKHAEAFADWRAAKRAARGERR